jgi:hypothetical protein
MMGDHGNNLVPPSSSLQDRIKMQQKPVNFFLDRVVKEFVFFLVLFSLFSINISKIEKMEWN